MTRPVEAILTIDSREQHPYEFSGHTSKHVAFEIATEGLAAGDYAARLPNESDPADVAVVERKSHIDLLGTLTVGRARFERELERLTEYGFSAIVIEANLADIAAGHPRSQANPRAIVASLCAFAQRFNVHVVFAGDRRHAEAYTWRLLERWVRDRADARESSALADFQAAQQRNMDARRKLDAALTGTGGGA